MPIVLKHFPAIVFEVTIRLASAFRLLLVEQPIKVVFLFRLFLFKAVLAVISIAFLFTASGLKVLVPFLRPIVLPFIFLPVLSVPTIS